MRREAQQLKAEARKLERQAVDHILDSAAVVDALTFFESREETMSTLIQALERCDTDPSRAMLKRLVRSRYLDYGRTAVAALARLNDVKTLLLFADEHQMTAV